MLATYPVELLSKLAQPVNENCDAAPLHPGLPMIARRQNFTISVDMVPKVNEQWGYWSLGFAT